MNPKESRMFSCLSRSVRRFGLLALTVLAMLAASRAALAVDYKLQPDDTLSVTVSGEPDLSREYKIDDQGDISMPMAGKIHLADLTLKQAQDKIHGELKKFLKVFELAVRVVGDTGGKVAVYGEVAKPGPLKMRPGSKLLEVIRAAGDLTPSADRSHVSIARKGGSKSETIDLDSILSDPTLDVEIGMGDTITIPSKISRTVIVDGEVQNPGPKPLDSARTAFAAIKSANPTENVDWTHVTLRRKGSSVPLTLDLSAVRKGALKDDLELQEGDRLTVSSKFAGTATIRGEVNKVGEKDLNGKIQLPDFISSAGGFTDKADRRHVRIIRDGKEQVVNLLAVETGEVRSDDPKLEVKPGDLIFVPQGTASIQGQVKNTGAKPIGEANHLPEFIAGAGGGFTEKADRTHVQIKRDGKVLRTVDLTAVESGEVSPDDATLEIQPGDVIIIPDDSKNRYSIVGGVEKPGSYRVEPGMTLLDALVPAGKFSERATYDKIVIAPANRLAPDGTLKLQEKERAEAKRALQEGPDGPDAQGGDEKPAGDKKGRKNEKADKNRDSEKGRDSGASDAKVTADEKKLADYGLTVVNYKKLAKGDLTQNVAIHPGDRILVPEKSPQKEHRGGVMGGFLGTVLRMMVPFGL
jgi:polysaccharide export outer membrane protein